MAAVRAMTNWAGATILSLDIRGPFMKLCPLKSPYWDVLLNITMVTKEH